MKLNTIIQIVLCSVIINSQTLAKSANKDAENFIKEVEKTLLTEGEFAAKTAWIQANFITQDSIWLRAKNNEKTSALTVQYALKASKFDHVQLPADMRRKMMLLKSGLTIAAPVDADKNQQLAEITSSLVAMYGTGKYCQDGNCQTLNDLEEVMTSSRNSDELLEAWQGWRTTSPPMKDKYAKMVELANEGAVNLGFKDTGAMWRSQYDMPADKFAQELDHQFRQVKPLYEALQCHVRAKLTEHYGKEIMGDDGMIPAHLLGNMWAQSWSNIYDLVKPAKADEGSPIDVTKLLKDNNYDHIKMVKAGERFFTSLGLPPLPETFWQRSLFLKPQDREVVCHASAWNLDSIDDLRIKMCIKIDEEDFITIHHELGHSFYQRAYNQLSIIYRNGANDGFHEAIGDTIALSMTPEYFQQIGLIKTAPKSDSDIGMLLKMALERVAFIPFGLMIDQWRWKVFNGEFPTDKYNQGWWQLRNHYQGVKAPIARTEDNFDPGAKYHIPGGTPYTRYFLAHILQFQFHRELCKTAGNTKPLHRCSIYNNKEAGAKLIKILEMGASRPWQDALEVIANSRKMDASAVLDYFAPLKVWLDEQNKDRDCGW
ncbi:Peptidyl-dipeptidase A precursor [hydrothermal vent metagenome]|uniref:Peptidyl-dipeptidase A n=1 Tax=hydrothermal vent metagenome TaxID=652676 RepID=A0A3B0VGR1_9ZZZZ